MLLLSNSAKQSVEAGQAIVFDTVLLHTGCSEGCGIRNRALTTTQAGLRQPGIYNLQFNGNIAGTAPNQLNIVFDGATLPETLMISNETDLQNVSANTTVRSCGGANVKVVNTGTDAVTISAGSVLSITRRA